MAKGTIPFVQLQKAAESQSSAAGAGTAAGGSVFSSLVFFCMMCYKKALGHTCCKHSSWSQKNKHRHIQRTQCRVRAVLEVQLLTVSCFLSDKRLAVFVTVCGDHRHLVKGLWSQPFQHRVGYVSWHRLLSGVLRKQRLPSNLVQLYVSRCCCPRHCEAGVSDITGEQVFRRACLWK